MSECKIATTVAAESGTDVSVIILNFCGSPSCHQFDEHAGSQKAAERHLPANQLHPAIDI